MINELYIVNILKLFQIENVNFRMVMTNILYCKYTPVDDVVYNNILRGIKGLAHETQEVTWVSDLPWKLEVKTGKGGDSQWDVLAPWETCHSWFLSGW